MVQKYKEGRVQTSTNLDGSYFGQSFPQIFLSNFDNMIEQPPKVYFYEPKIHGFRIAGQRGSKYFNPARTSVFAKPLNTDTCYSSSGRKNCTNPNCKTTQCTKIKTVELEKAVSPPQSSQVNNNPNKKKRKR